MGAPADALPARPAHLVFAGTAYNKSRVSSVVKTTKNKKPCTCAGPCGVAVVERSSACPGCGRGALRQGRQAIAVTSSIDGLARNTAHIGKRHQRRANAGQTAADPARTAGAAGCQRRLCAGFLSICCKLNTRLQNCERNSAALSCGVKRTSRSSSFARVMPT